MFTPTPAPAPSHLEQQRKLAKDLVRAARAGDLMALARIQAVRSDAGLPSRPLKLADAQLAVAREAGFDSWPPLHTSKRILSYFRLYPPNAHQSHVLFNPSVDITIDLSYSSGIGAI